MRLLIKFGSHLVNPLISNVLGCRCEVHPMRCVGGLPPMDRVLGDFIQLDSAEEKRSSWQPINQTCGALAIPFACPLPSSLGPSDVSSNEST